MRLSSPAKINLFLRITGRRPNGYHDLQTVFQLLTLKDEITITPAAHGNLQITCSDTDLETPDNLAHQAALMLRERLNIALGATIHISKQIPVGGGLGGGSSNAATVLLGLNQLWRGGLSIDELAQLGLALGADVPLFVRGETAWAEGLGERLTPIELPRQTYVIVNPGCHVSTSAIFLHPDLTRDSSSSTIARFLDQGTPLVGKNDCESVVCDLFPEVQKALAWLRQWGPASMTGTGASIFLPVQDDQLCEEIKAKAPASWTVFATVGTQKSALHTELDKYHE